MAYYNPYKTGLQISYTQNNRGELIIPLFFLRQFFTFSPLRSRYFDWPSSAVGPARNLTDSDHRRIVDRNNIHTYTLVN